MMWLVGHRFSVFFFFLLTCGLTLNASARQWVMNDAPPPPRDMGELLSRFEQAAAPGAALTVIKDGEALFTGAFGKANLEYDIDITPQTVFGVASVSKQFTAFAIAMLADQGKLSLNDDIRKHLPEVPDLGETVTIRHLIHHTSGLPDELGMLRLAGWRFDDPITNADVMAIVSRLDALDYTPGDRHIYSNTNYTVLAAIIERVTGTSFAAWTQANLFEPLGMHSTRFVDAMEALVPNRAMNYDRDEADTLVRRPDVWFNVGPGGLYSTVEDLAIWAQNLTTGKVGGKAVIEQMRKADSLNDGTSLDYAFGLVHGEDQGLRMISHGGSAPGLQSNLRLYPDQNVAIIALSNSGGGLMRLHDLVQQTADFHLGDEMQQPDMASGGGRMMMITEEQLNAEVTSSYEPNLDRFDAYTGTYEVAEGEGLLSRLLLVTREGNQLRMAFGEPPGMPLVPIAEDRFRMHPLNFEITFHIGEAGETPGLTFHVTEDSFGDEEPHDLQGIKHQKVDRSPQSLSAYRGTYYSPVLETYYRVTVEDDHLAITHQRHGTLHLKQLAPNEFLADTHIFTNVSFARDETDRVVSVRLKGFSWSSSAVLHRVELP